MMDIMKYAIEGYKDVEAQQYIGIFGNPINHTMSPIIHNTISRQLGKNMSYIPFHITEKLGDAVKTAYDDGIIGLNITVPFKQQVMEHLVDIDDAAKVIGAVNTLVRCEGGFKGYNTDMPGLAKALMAEGVQLEGANIIMLGAGGAARAVAYMCLNYGANKVYIVNRTFDNAKKIADDMNQAFKCNKIHPVAACDYKNIPNNTYIMIQCTSVGLHPEDGLPIVEDDDFYNMVTIGVDLIYNPARTAFLNLIERKGGKAINGLGMLLYQGIMAYELWNDVKINDEVASDVLKTLEKSVYSKCDNIVLIGYMGAGKTAVGKYLAEKYGYKFLDMDEYIVDREGMSINDIFATKGEEYFRQLETDTLIELRHKLNNTVLSTGGGAPVKEENRRLLKSIGKVFYLEASADITYKRVSGNTDRPLLAGDNMYDKICNMLSIRVPMYKDTADVVIKTDEISIECIADLIIKQV